MQSTKLVHEPLWISKVKVIHWLWSKVTQIQHFKTSFPKKKTLDWLKPYFMWSLHGMEEWKQVQMVYITRPRWQPCPYMLKNLSKSSSLEPKGRWTWNLVCSIEYSSTTKFVQRMPLGWHWPILRQGHIWSPMLFYGKKVKTMDLSEITVVCDVKVSRCS